MDIESIMYNEISQTKKNTIQSHLYVESNKKTIRQKTPRKWDQMCGYQRQGVRKKQVLEKGSQRVEICRVVMDSMSTTANTAVWHGRKL